MVVYDLMSVLRESREFRSEVGKSQKLHKTEVVRDENTN